MRVSDYQLRKMFSLRQLGYSLPEISKKLSIPKTTVFRHINKVQILPQYKSEWILKRGGSRKTKLLKEKMALREGKIIVGELTKKEKLLILSSLYWAEGSKKDFGLSNTDYKLIKTFVTILKKDFGIEGHRFRISVRIYEDLDKDRCLSFWSKVVGIPKEEFVGVNIIKGAKKGKLEYGMCRVRISKGGDLLKRINGINQSVVEKLGL